VSDPLNSSKRSRHRNLGLLGATSVGIGAIVGGGILALAGTAFAQTGPSAIVAFFLNGLIALLTALSFAEVASKFPESGGTYTFAKKVLSVESAFTVGWIVWFASVVAASLYAIGFGQFAVASATQITAGMQWDGLTQWLQYRATPLIFAVLATLVYTGMLVLRSAGGGKWENIGKLIVFSLLIVLGFWALREREFGEVKASLSPFFANGATGLFQAMGYTFIAVQGFDLIAAVGGEVKDPERNIPRAMIGSLVIALIVYLPLLFVISTAGVPTGESIVGISQANPDTIIAVAAENYLGAFGYWLVMVAALLSMLSAMQANLFAASRVASAMAADRTLPSVLARLSAKTRIPRFAVAATCVLVLVTTIALPDIASAGAASSLIFLITFALAHWICILVRQRSVKHPPPFRTILFPAVPLIGGSCCLVLAVFQGVAVPSAGTITVCWLALGGILFLFLFAHRARLSDVTNQIYNPELLRLRGRSPLVLVPIANPDNAACLVTLANAISPREVGRVLLLSIAVAPDDWNLEENPRPIENTQHVLKKALSSSVSAGRFPEALTTIARDPWEEIRRVAKVHRCESLLLGLTSLTDKQIELPLEKLVRSVSCDVVVLRASSQFSVEQANRILVPTTGRRIDDPLLAKILASFSKDVEREITFLSVVPEGRSAVERRQAQKELTRWGHNLCSSNAKAVVVASDSPKDVVLEHANVSDLMIIGASSGTRSDDRQLVSPFAWQIIEETECPILLARHHA
jgi:APA family basic amino acid/polyamine antiporter